MLRTAVLEIKAPRKALYWRAALLDVFAGDRWSEGPPISADFREPAAARDRRNWLRQDVTVKALSDTRLVGASIPISFAAGDAPLPIIGAVHAAVLVAAAGAAIVFKDASPEAIEAFVNADPYTEAGLITGWRMEPYKVV